MPQFFQTSNSWLDWKILVGDMTLNVIHNATTEYVQSYGYQKGTTKSELCSSIFPYFSDFLWNSQTFRELTMIEFMFNTFPDLCRNPVSNLTKDMQTFNTF